MLTYGVSVLSDGDGCAPLRRDLELSPRESGGHQGGGGEAGLGPELAPASPAAVGGRGGRQSRADAAHRRGAPQGGARCAGGRRGLRHGGRALHPGRGGGGADGGAPLRRRRAGGNGRRGRARPLRKRRLLRLLLAVPHCCAFYAIVFVLSVSAAPVAGAGEGRFCAILGILSSFSVSRAIQVRLRREKTRRRRRPFSLSNPRIGFFSSSGFFRCRNRLSPADHRMTPSSSLLPFLLSSSLFLLLFLSSSSIKNQLHAPLPSSPPPPPSSSSYPGGSDAEGAKGDYERTSDAALTAFSEGKKRKEISSALSCRSPIKQPRLFFSPRPLHLFSFPSFYFQVFSSPAASTSVFAPSFLLPVFPFFLVKHSGKTRKSTGGGRERGRENISASLSSSFSLHLCLRGERKVCVLFVRPYLHGIPGISANCVPRHFLPLTFAPQTVVEL